MRAESRRAHLAGDELTRSMRAHAAQGDAPSFAREVRARHQFNRLVNEDVCANDDRLARFGAQPSTILYRHARCPRSPALNLAAWHALRVVMHGERADGSPAPCWNCPGCGSTISEESLEPVPECVVDCDLCAAGYDRSDVRP